MMESVYLMDACAIFAFFQLADPDSTEYLNRLNISKKLKKIFYKMLIEEINIIIPVPALAEFMYKLFKNQRIEKFNIFIEELEKRKNFDFYAWDYKVLKRMGKKLTNNIRKIEDYSKENRKSLELFDLCIYAVAKVNNITKILTRDQVFCDLFDLRTIW
ncbi:MAG: PIN domain-containing protein [Candidatus Lokiarchaeota archaeon]|nr:PIN domain-containing protein [Candidatus Lokiarchaeota archaeon]